MIDFLNKLADRRIYVDLKEGKLKLLFEGDAIAPELLGEIKSRKEEIIAYLKDFGAKGPGSVSPIGKAPVRDGYPLSPAQHRLWVLSRMEEASLAYNIPYTIALSGPYDLSLLKKAIHAVVERHEILRTVFRQDVTGEARQWVMSSGELGFVIGCEDLQAAENADEIIEAYGKKDVQRPFDLENGPLLRACIFQLAPQEQVLYYNMHHIISDGWSMEVLARDVKAFYTAYAAGAPPRLPQLPVQYKDVACWQLEQLRTEAYQESKRYWQDCLSGELPRLTLPTGKVRPKLFTNRGARVETLMPAPELLRSFAQQKGGTLFTGLVSVWSVLLYRYTGQQDVLLGTPVAGREHADLDDQIGFYVNTLVLRNQILPEDSFRTVYDKVHQGTLTAFTHQHYPFDRVVEDLAPGRDISRTPVFDVMLTLQNAGASRQAGTGAVPAGTNTCVEDVTAKFDLDVMFEEMGEALAFSITFNTDIYERAMVEGLMNHFRQLLRALQERPELPVGRVDYLAPLEKEQLLSAFNATRYPYPAEKTVIDLFREQVGREPLRVAVECDGVRLTYRELDEASNQMAGYLVEKYQVGPEAFVGVLLERSEWMVVSILAILKTGAAYIPIDPSYPPAKAAYIQGESNCSVCIDAEELEAFRRQRHRYPVAALPRTIVPGSLAYVIYTSGSTGMPKGVMIEHASLVHYLSWCDACYLTGKLSNFDFGLYSSLSFDLTVTSLFLPLIKGSKLKVFGAGKDIAEVLREYAASGLACIKLTPAHISLLERLEIDTCRLEMAIVGGEALHANQVSTLQRLNPAMAIYNEYGPTEATVGCVVCPVHEAAEITIGRPIHNMEVHILNELHQLEPVGVTGELCLSGAGLARGYLNQPGLTGGKFIAHPFKTGERLYKTGDLARWRPDGNIDYLGRKDDQVKIRGYRIELGEIESQLRLKESIKEAVAVVVSAAGQEAEIVAYFTAGQTQQVAELRDFLSARIADYMVPARFVQLESLPLTTNGKVDKKALPPPGLPVAAGAPAAPRNELERQLAGLWQQVLEKDAIGPEDHFFRMGGHSIKAVSLTSAIHKTLGVKLTLKQIFLHPSIREQARLIEASKLEGYEDIAPVTEADDYAVSAEQKRLWVLSQQESTSLAYNMPFQIEIREEIDVPGFEKAILDTIRRHEILRTLFREGPTGEVRQQVIPFDRFGFKLDVVDLRQVSDQEGAAADYWRGQSSRPFDLENGPLIRAGLLQLGPGNLLLCYTMHHIIGDGLSQQILLKDVFNYYQAYKDGVAAQVPPLPVQYKDYAAWQHRQLTPAKDGEQTRFWKSVFREGIPRVQLPFQKSRPAAFTFTGNRIRFEVGSQVKEGLEAVSARHGGSMYITALFLVKLLIHKYVGNRKIMVGSSFSTRTHAALENQIGFYVNNLPLVTQVHEESGLGDLYEGLRDHALQVGSTPWYPLERLIDQVGYQYDPAYTSLFNVLVEYHGQDRRTADAPPEPAGGSQQARYEDNVPCQFDLSLEFYENDWGLTCILLYNNALFDKSQMELFRTRLAFLAHRLVKCQNDFHRMTAGELTVENHPETRQEINKKIDVCLEENF